MSSRKMASPKRKALRKARAEANREARKIAKATAILMETEVRELTPEQTRAGKNQRMMRELVKEMLQAQAAEMQALAAMQNTKSPV